MLGLSLAVAAATVALLPELALRSVSVAARWPRRHPPSNLDGTKSIATLHSRFSCPPSTCNSCRMFGTEGGSCLAAGILRQSRKRITMHRTIPQSTNECAEYRPLSLHGLASATMAPCGQESLGSPVAEVPGDGNTALANLRAPAASARPTSHKLTPDSSAPLPLPFGSPRPRECFHRRPLFCRQLCRPRRLPPWVPCS